MARGRHRAEPARVLIRGGRVVDQRGTRRADVLVDEGAIAAVGADLEAGSATVLDAGGCVVAPGLVDLHTHLREPGFEEAETVDSGARGAALGGYTAVVAMPNTEPAIDSAGKTFTLDTRSYMFTTESSSSSRLSNSARMMTGVSSITSVIDRTPSVN